jgi:DNA polymerase-1
MERAGFRLDSAALRALGEEMTAAAAECEEAIFRMAGGAFNLNSPKQLSEVLFERLSLPTGRKKPNKSGFYPTDAETLSALRFVHPIVGLILDYRHLTKLTATYVEGLLDAVDGDGRLRTDFKQSLTATGRLSSAEPNLQNIPIRTPQGQRIRRCFVTEEDWVLVDADYSQIELRLLAALSGDPVMTETFQNGGDIHRETAAAVFGVAPEEVTDEMRKKAKAVNFGIVYGISAFSLAGDLEISNAEAKQYIESYYAKYPTVKEYLDSLPEKATALGYSETLCGRRRWIPELSSTNHMTREFGKRVARNSPIQGTAADLIKYAMILVDERLQREEPRARLVMQVHDELVVECPREAKDRVAAILKEEMERVTYIPECLTPDERGILLPVPLTVEVSVTENWLE